MRPSSHLLSNVLFSLSFFFLSGGICERCTWVYVCVPACACIYALCVLWVIHFSFLIFLSLSITGLFPALLAPLVVQSEVHHMHKQENKQK